MQLGFRFQRATDLTDLLRLDLDNTRCSGGLREYMFETSSNLLSAECD